MTDEVTPTPIPEKSIAVLPFENLSEEKDNAFFADGMQDDVLTSLAKVKDIKVDVTSNSRKQLKQLFSSKRFFEVSITANPSETVTDARVPLEADYTSVPGRTLNRN